MSGTQSDKTALFSWSITTQSLWTRVLLAAAAAAVVGFAIHVLYGRGWAEAYVQNAARAGRLNNILHEPYSALVTAIALITALLPACGKVVAYLLIRDNLPGRSRIIKGIWFGALLTAMTDALIRVPIMSVVVGNPVDVMLIQSFEGWLIGPATGIAIAVLVL